MRTDRAVRLAHRFKAGTALLLAAAALHAQEEEDLSLQDLFSIKVQSTSFFEMSQDRAPGYVTIIDQNAMENSAARSLTDLLSDQVAGIETGWHFLTGSLIGARGILIDANAKTLLMVDGYNLNYRKHWGAMGAQIDQPFLGYIDHVEVVHGPGNLVHGSGAINGFVNMIPKTGASDPGFHGSVEGAYPEMGGNAQLGYGLNYGEGQDLYVFGGVGLAQGFLPEVYSDSGTYKAFNSDNQGYYDLDGEEGTRAFSTGNMPRYNLFANWNHGGLHIEGGMFSNAVNVTLPGGWIGDWAADSWLASQGMSHSTTLWANPSYTLDLGEINSLKLSLNAHMHDVLKGFPDSPISEDLRSVAKEGYISGRVLFKSDLSDVFKFSVGGQFGRRNFEDGNSYLYGEAGESAETVEGGDSTRWLEGAGYGEGLLTLGSFVASIGARYDFVSFGEYTDNALDIQGYQTPESFVGHFSPRIALSFGITDNDVIKTSYQQGFRYPDLQHMASVLNNNWMAEDTTRFLASEEDINQAVRNHLSEYPLEPVEPELMHSVELNYVRTFGFPLRTAANLYFNIFQDAIAWSTEYAAVRNAAGTFYAVGGELIADYNPMEALGVRFSYGLSMPIGITEEINSIVSLADPEEQKSWFAYSAHQIKLGLTQSLIDKSLNLYEGFGIYSGLSENLPDKMEVLMDPRLEFSLSAKYTILERFWVQARARNLLGTLPSTFAGFDWVDAGHSGHESRFFYLSAGVNF